MPPASFRTRMITATFVASVAIGHQSAANTLEDCEDLGTNDIFICGIAAEFGAQAAFLRDALNSIEGSAGLRRSAKSGSGREWFGLAVAGGQVTFGNFEGSSANLIAGADTVVSSSTSLGAMVFLETGSITAPASPTVDREGVLIGPYFATRLPDQSVLNGHLLYGEPDYTVNNVTTSGETVLGALTWSRSISRQGLDFGPFVSVAAKRERPDAATEIDARILTIGSSFDGEVIPTDSGFQQIFGRLEMDFGSYSDNLGTDISYVAPRAVVGGRFAFNNGGALQALANVSVASDATTIVAGQVSYRIDF